jgi:hypothetical protein
VLEKCEPSHNLKLTSLQHCREYLLQDQRPLHVPARQRVHLECDGRFINFYSAERQYLIGSAPPSAPESDLLLGTGATLSLSNCDVSSFKTSKAASNLPVNQQMPLRIFGNTPGSTVEMVNSTAQTPCPVRTHLGLL